MLCFCRPYALHIIILALIAGCVSLRASTPETDPAYLNQSSASTGGLNSVEIDPVDSQWQGVAYIILLIGIAGPPIALYCAFKKPVSLLLRRLSIAALIIWIPLGILLTGGMLYEAFVSGHLLDMVYPDIVVFASIFLLVAFAWVYALFNIKVKSKSETERVYFR